jgi:cytochrome P450
MFSKREDILTLDESRPSMQTTPVKPLAESETSDERAMHPSAASVPRVARATGLVPLHAGGLPYAGHVARAWRDPIGLLRDALAEHPGASRLRFGPWHYVVVSSPDSVKHILTDNAKAYEKSRNYDGLKIVFGQGLLTSEGEFWKRQRRLVQPAFHRQKLAKLTAQMASETRRALDRWHRGDRNEHVHEEMMRLTFAIVGRTLFSADVDGDASEIGRALSVGLEWTNDYAEAVVRIPRWVPTPKNREFSRALATLDALVFRLIASRRAADDVGDDLLGMLMSATDESGHERMTDRQLRDEALTLVVAGHETTANLLAFAFHLLARHPEWQDKVVAEAHEVLGTNDPTFDDVPELAVARAVIEETLRLYPPAWAFERQAVCDDEIAEGKIPKGSIVGVVPFLVHRDPKVFPDPEAFDPTRFAPGTERPKYGYLPFGGGPRTCIGNQFALTEAIVSLTMIARDFRAVPRAGRVLELDPKVTLRPKDDVPVRFERR